MKKSVSRENGATRAAGRPGFLARLLVPPLLGLALPALTLAEEINYSGPGSWPLAVNPGGELWVAETGGQYRPGAPDSIFPASFSGNAVTVTGLSGSGPYFIYGGIRLEPGEVADNTVAVSASSGFAAIGGVALDGDSHGHAVTVLDGAVAEWGVMGGITLAGDSYGNAIHMTGATAAAAGLGAGHTWEGEAYDNLVTMTDGLIIAEGVTAGSSSNGLVRDNKIEISGGHVKGEGTGSSFVFVGAGFAEDGEATGNRVDFSGGLIGNRAYEDALLTGAISLNGAVRNNTLAVSGGAVYGGGADAAFDPNIGMPLGVNGALTISGEAENNLLEISGGVVYGDIAGGLTFGGDAVGNKIDISGAAALTGGLAGGFTLEGLAADNLVNVAGGTINSPDGLVGGIAFSGDATGNSVNFSGGSLEGPAGAETLLAGGFTQGGKARNNTVAVSGGLVRGGEADLGQGLIGGLTMAGEASGNTLTISGGQTYGDMAGGLTFAGDAFGNTFNIAGGDLDGGYIGGVAVGFDLATMGVAAGDAYDNKLIISGGNIANGDHAVGGAAFMGGSAYRNTVDISGGVVDHPGGGIIIGGLAMLDAHDNSVNITGGAVNNMIVAGGATYAADRATVDNSVRLSGSPSLVNVDLYGGYYRHEPGYSPDVDPTGDRFSGNALKIWKYSGTSVGDIAGFQFYDFILPETLADGGTALVSTGTVSLGDGAGRSSQISINTAGGSPLAQGYAVTLIDAAVLDDADYTQTEAVGQYGALLDYRWTLSADYDRLEAVLTGLGAKPQTKALAEARLGGLTFVSQAADMVAGQGLANAVSSAQASAGLASFAAASAGKSKYKTGSHVDVDSSSFLIGLAKGFEAGAGRLTLGAFFEAGRGDYDSFNSFAGSSSVTGNGDADYLGGGLMGRYDSDGSSTGHFHAEASARFGQVKTDFASPNLSSLPISYEADSAYYGFHAGLGYVWSISGRADLDLYGQYLWTRQEGKAVILSTGDPVNFDDADSHRLRGGARLTYAVYENIKPYVGLAYEHELDGQASASLYGQALPTPELKGDTGIGELGLEIEAGNSVKIDLGLQGYAGQREGFSGSLGLKFEF
ncbi:MAG: autotransporter outer membrane beta-barrel domain-containing protein [Candidatus Adiutrix sp.]|jgi:hypothetical protein|nr:autotransporter outer membrane beta-barrel domain-containing protein [Candidatus Adiutrix sp.]